MSFSDNKLFLFDRDGIINVRPVNDYVKQLNEFHFHPDFFELFSLLNNLGFHTAVITNQQGVGKGLMSEATLIEIHKHMQDALSSKTGYKFDKIFYCTSLKEVNDYRRKPNPGMLEEAIKFFNLDKENTFFMGDSTSDIIAGKEAGVKTILINSEIHEEPDYYFQTLKEFIIYLKKNKYPFS
jgi:D-glycero-D-manno-heptose 1,7-bisphosphate phosphatase